jgi:ubiquinone/menaquinone biosynthesis C-methylase UbiE
MEFYKEAAEEFSRTRTAIWPGVLQFINSVDTNSTILDAGCGNGKNMMKTSHNFIGLDSCEELLNIVRTKAKSYNKTNIVDIVNASVTDIPFEDNTFDAIMSIAVIHHIDTFAYRVRAFEEIIRVCKPGGKVLITVWQMENNPKYLDGFDLNPIADLNLVSDPITDITNIKSSPYIGDKLIRWKLQDAKCIITGEMFRFYHFYSEDEVKDMISYCENKFNVKGSYFEERFNYYIRFDLI